MRRFVAVFLTVLLLISPASVMLTFAENNDGHFRQEEYEEAVWIGYQLFHSDAGVIWDYLTEEEYYPLSAFAEKIDEDVWTDIFYELTDTKYSEEECRNLLIKYITMLELKPDELVEKQEKFDKKKKLAEYGIDALVVGSDLISIHALGPGATSTMQTISTALGLTTSAAELTYDTIEKIEYADWAIRNYEKYSLFLNSIIKYSNKQELKSAASQLLFFSQKVLYSRLLTASEVSGDTAEFLGKDVFFDTVFLEGMLKDPSTLSLSEIDYQVVSSLKTCYQTVSAYWKALKDLWAFGTDVLGGLTDVCAQYLEIQVLTEIRRCLVMSAKELNETIKSADDYELIFDFYSVLSNLAYVHYRSVYCLMDLYTANKAKLYGVVISLTDCVRLTDRAQTAEKIIDRYEKITLNAISCISIAIPDKNLYYEVPDNAGGGQISGQIVMDAYHYDGSEDVTDKSLLEYHTLSYSIPEIKLPGDEIKALNQEIYNKLYPQIEETKEALKSGNNNVASYDEISYSWALNGDILSIWISYDLLNYDNPWWDVYNISVSNKHVLTKQEFLSAYGISPQDYREKAKQAMVSYYLDWFLEHFRDDAYFLKQLNKTESEGNIDDAIPFINEDGHLCIQGYIYSLVGGTGYHRIIDLDTFKLSEYYDQFSPSLVSDAYSHSIEYKVKRNDREESRTAEFHIPVINLNSLEIKQLNQSIYDRYYHFIESSIEDCKHHGSPFYLENLKYSWHVNGDILQLQTQGDLYVDGGPITEIYSILISECRLATKQEVLAACGFDQEHYETLAKQALGSAFLDATYDWKDVDWYGESRLKTDYQRTISADNIAEAQPFIGENGHLFVFGGFYWPVQDGHCECIIDLESFTLSPHYEEISDEAKLTEAQIIALANQYLIENRDAADNEALPLSPNILGIIKKNGIEYYAVGFYYWTEGMQNISKHFELFFDAYTGDYYWNIR